MGGGVNSKEDIKHCGEEGGTSCMRACRQAERLEIEHTHTYICAY